MTSEQTGRVDIDKATLTYGTGGRDPFVALSETSITLEPGLFTALLGPSGCGKSSLLNMVAGFNPPTGGSIKVDGKLITQPTADVGVVFQQYALFPWFTARGNVEFALKRLNIGKAERRERAIEALQDVGLGDYVERYPGELSGGMKQRVALARTFAATPKVLLMDEPFGALDAFTRMSMHELLLREWQRHKVTVLFVTHDIDEALYLADQIHVMKRGPGRIVETFDLHDPRPRSHTVPSKEQRHVRERVFEHLLQNHQDVAEEVAA